MLAVATAEQLKAARSAVSYYAHQALRHNIDPFQYEVTAREMVWRCAKCGEMWTLDFTAMRPSEIVEQVATLMKQQGQCRGKPLYQRIPGTPWFKYNA